MKMKIFWNFIGKLKLTYFVDLQLSTTLKIFQCLFAKGNFLSLKTRLIYSYSGYVSKIILIWKSFNRIASVNVRRKSIMICAVAFYISCHGLTKMSQFVVGPRMIVSKKLKSKWIREKTVVWHVTVLMDATISNSTWNCLQRQYLKICCIWKDWAFRLAILLYCKFTTSKVLIAAMSWMSLSD